MKLLVTPPRITREYETIFIVRPNSVEEERAKVIERFEGIIAQLEGHILKHEDWGKRKLAYEIQKQSQGIYHYYRFLGYGDLIAELERNLRILEPVIKFMTIKLDADLDRDARIAKAEATPVAASASPNDEAPVLATDDDDDDDE